MEFGLVEQIGYEFDHNDGHAGVYRLQTKCGGEVNILCSLDWALCRYAKIESGTMGTSSDQNPALQLLI